MSVRLVLSAMLATLMPVQAALAACPSELAVYRDLADAAGIDFRPAGEGAAITNVFRLPLKNGPVLHGVVMWTEAPSQSWGVVTLDCPEGDVTGEELRQCTVWEGPVYAMREDGTAGYLPREGEPAATHLILAGLSYQVQAAPALAERQPDLLPDDIFQLSGCQE